MADHTELTFFDVSCIYTLTQQLGALGAVLYGLCTYCTFPDPFPGRLLLCMLRVVFPLAQKQAAYLRPAAA